MTVVVHLSVKGRAACGRPLMMRWSTHPHEVTCSNCKSTIHMADSEAKAAASRNRRGRKT